MGARLASREQGTGYICLDCPEFDYCYKYIYNSASHYNSTHKFEIYNKSIYFASGTITVSVLGQTQRFGHSAICEASHETSTSHLITLPASGFLVNSIRGIRTPGSIVYETDGLTFGVDQNEWKSLPGMKDIDLDEDGQLGDKFCRALTGNRKIVDDRVCHIPEEELKLFKKSYTSSKTPKLRNDSKLADSIAFMLSNSRRFATTEGSLGFVPYEARAGDRIAILLGRSVPVVIRALSSEEGDPWLMIGECYIEGLMAGEYMEVVRERNLSYQEINLI